MAHLEIKELSKDSFGEAHSHPMLEVEAVLQYIGASPRTINDCQIFFGCFSNGFHKEDLGFAPGLRKDFEETTQLFDVLRLKFYLFNKREACYFLIHSFERVFTGLWRQIGDPRPFAPESPCSLSGASSNLIPPEAEPVRRPEDLSRPRPPPYQEFLRKRERPDLFEAKYNKIGELRAGDRSWLLKARVVNKTELRPFRKNQGKYFSVVLCDASGQIRATFFKTVSEQYYETIKEGKVYSFAGGEIERASNFNTTSNQFEVLFKDNIHIRQQPEDAALPRGELALVSIRELLAMQDNTVVDLLALVREPAEVELKELRRGGAKELRKILLADDSGEQIEVNVWGELAYRAQVARDQLYLFKGLKLKTYNDSKYLLWENYTRAVAGELDCAAYKRLKEWQATARPAPRRGAKTAFAPTATFEFGPRNNFAVISEIVRRTEEFFSDPGNKYKKQFFEFSGFVSVISSAIWYDSCGFLNCKKRVSRNEQGVLFCDKCSVETREPVPRFMADLKVVDCSGQIFGRVFGEENCANIFNKGIGKLKELREKNEEEFSQVLSDLQNSEFHFRAIIKRNEMQINDPRLVVEFLSVTQIEKSLESVCPRLLENLPARFLQGNSPARSNRDN